MGSVLNDVRFCLRGFARRPLFAIVVVATLALGLSVNAAIFSLYDQVLLRELRVSAADDVVGRSLLFGLAPTDPFVPTVAVAALAGVILTAAYWPARRAAHVDPVTALRGD